MKTDPYRQATRREWSRKYDPRLDIEANLVLIDRLRDQIAKLKTARATMYLVPRKERP